MKVLHLLPALLLAAGLPAMAASDVIYTGQPMKTPLEVAYAYLKDRIADENGLAQDYRNLAISQQGAGEENLFQVKLSISKEDLYGDPRLNQRYRFEMNFSEEKRAWEVISVTEEWQCRKAKSKAWVQRPCK